jgi:hypothetical protein
MAYQSTFDDPGRDTGRLYRRTLHVLSDARVPFLVGGSHALLNYTGIVRDTKDFDLFLRRGISTQRSCRCVRRPTPSDIPHWLAKAKQGMTSSIVFSPAMACAASTTRGFNSRQRPTCWNARQDRAGRRAAVAKAFVMERERYDGATSRTFFAARIADWDRVVQRFDPHWQLLLSYLVLFAFICRRSATAFPAVLTTLTQRLEQDTAAPPTRIASAAERCCRARSICSTSALRLRRRATAPRGKMSPRTPSLDVGDRERSLKPMRVR